MEWESDLWQKVTDIYILKKAIKKYEEELKKVSKEDHLHLASIEYKIYQCKNRVDYLTNNLKGLRIRCPYCFYNHQADSYFDDYEYEEGFSEVKIMCSQCEKDFLVDYDKKKKCINVFEIDVELEPTFTVLAELGNYIDNGVILFNHKYYSFDGYYYDCGDYVMVNYLDKNEEGETRIEEVGRIEGDGVNDVVIKIYQNNENHCKVAYATKEEQKKLEWVKDID